MWQPWQPTGYLEITPSVAYTVLSEILTSSGIEIDEPDSRKIEQLLTPSEIPPIPMVSIPLDNSPAHEVQETYREMQEMELVIAPPASPVPVAVSHEQVPASLEIANYVCPTAATNFNQVELALLAQCGVMDEDNMELSYLRTTLSLSMMEAEFLRMQLRLFNLKARSILELFQYCEGPNAGFCRCPDIRKRIYEMGILVQRQ